MTAQGMSAGTAKTPKVVEGEARQPGSEGMRPMTGAAPLPEEAVTDAPSKAVRDEMGRIRALFVSGPGDKEDLITYAKEIAAMRAATQPTALPEEEVMRRALLEALTPSAKTKAAYHGEFVFDLDVGVSDAGVEQYRKVYVPWDTVKQIMAAIKARALLKGQGK